VSKHLPKHPEAKVQQFQYPPYYNTRRNYQHLQFTITVTCTRKMQLTLHHIRAKLSCTSRFPML